MRPLLFARYTPSLLAAFLLPLHGSFAGVLTWNGGVSGDWQNGAGGWLDAGSPANWNNATPDAAVFSGSTPTTANVHATGVTAGNISVATGTYTIAGSGTLSLASTTLDVASGAQATVSAALSGSTGLVKSGPGLLIFSGTNKGYSGGTTITGGAIQLTTGSAGAIGAGSSPSVSLNGGALYTNFSVNQTPGIALSIGASGGELRNINTSGRYVFGSNVVSGSGALTLSFGTGAARIAMTGTGTTQTGFSGRWVVDGNGGNAANGFFDLYAAGNLGTGTGDDLITLQNGGKILVRGFALGASQGITIGTGGGQIANAGGVASAVAGKISGGASNALTLDLGSNAASVLALSSTSNAWLGDTTLVNQGILRLGTSGVIPDLGGLINVSSTSSVLDLNGQTETVGGITGPGIVDNLAAATAAVFSAGANGASTTFSGVIRNSGSSATLALAKTGTGTLTLTGTANTHSGGSTVAGGVLRVESAGSLGSGNVAIAATSGSASTGNRAQLMLHQITVTGKTLTMDSSVNRAVLLSSGAAGATWSGTVTLTGSASPNGGSELTNNAGNGPLTVAGSINGAVSGGGALTIRGDNANNALSATVNIGSTPLVKTDSGRWTISSTGNTWGTTTISSGTLALGASGAIPAASNITLGAAALSLGGTFSLGGPRTGTLALSGNGILDFGTPGNAQNLVFGASDGISWGGFTLTISNWEPSSDTLRFGGDASALTILQLASITFTGYAPGAQIDSTGLVLPIPEPGAGGLVAAGAIVVALRRRRGGSHR